MRELVGRAPQIGAGEETVFEAGAHHALEIGIVQIVGLNGADVFVREVDARDAFVVGGKSDGDPEHAIERERVVFAADAEDYIVAGQADLHHHMSRGHLFH